MCVIRVFVINVKKAEQNEPRHFVGLVMASDMILSDIGSRMSSGPEIKYLKISSRILFFNLIKFYFKIDKSNVEFRKSF